jgi:hypothetical protein
LLLLAEASFDDDPTLEAAAPFDSEPVSLIPALLLLLSAAALSAFCGIDCPAAAPGIVGGGSGATPPAVCPNTSVPCPKSDRAQSVGRILRCFIKLLSRKVPHQANKKTVDILYCVLKLEQFV